MSQNDSDFLRLVTNLDQGRLKSNQLNSGLWVTNQSIELCEDFMGSYCVILLTNRQKDTGENIASFAELKYIEIQSL